MGKFKIGDRVNVETNVKYDWQEKYFTKNGLVREVNENYLLVSSDEKTIFDRRGHTPLGILYFGGYLITKIK